MQTELKLPSPLQKTELPLFDEKGIEVFIKRDDLIHPEISGNKWRKLKYNILHAQNAGNDQLLTFGGAYSNHIAATAAACAMFKLPSIGIIRGEEADLNNPTLSAARNQGMKIIPVTRQEYSEKEEPVYLEHLHERFPNTHIVPEGGANYFGLNGCMEITKEIEIPFDTIICACGTGTTLAGIAVSLGENQHVIGFPAIKNGHSLLQAIRSQIGYALFDTEWTNDILQKISLQTNYHFGGFAKVSDELKNFRSDFLDQTKIDLDLIYTAKMMYGFIEMVKNNQFSTGQKIVIYHSGGLQGNKGFET